MSQLGAGIRLEKDTPKEIYDAVREVLENSSYHEKAAEISAGFKKCTGARGAAEKILQVCGK